MFSSVGLGEGFLGVKITRIPYHSLGCDPMGGGWKGGGEEGTTGGRGGQGAGAKGGGQKLRRERQGERGRRGECARGRKGGRGEGGGGEGRDWGRVKGGGVRAPGRNQGAPLWNSSHAAIYYQALHPIQNTVLFTFCRYNYKSLMQ